MLGKGWKKYIFKNNNQISSTAATRTWVFSTEWTRMWSSIGVRMKKWWSFPFVWMVDVLIQGAWVLYRNNKDKGDASLHLLAFRRHVVNMIFLKYSKEGRLSSSHLGFRNIPSDICYAATKHYAIWTQAYSERLQTSKSQCFCVNSKQLKVVNWIHKNTPS